MVKHQRRSHQRGLNPNEALDDCTSESDGGESPATPKHSGMQWPVQGVIGTGSQPMAPAHTLHRAASFADFGQHMNQYNMTQPPYGHRHTVSGGHHEYHGQPVHGQHPGVQMLHRTTGVPQTYYITEQNNPGIATMNTSAITQQYHQIPRQQVERLPLEIPYSAPAVTSSIQSSPGSFSPASGRSPSTQEGFYTHQATQAATYALHATSPVEQQQQTQQSMVSYPTPVPQQLNQQAVGSPQQAVASQTQPQEPPAPAPATSEQQYQQSTTQAEADQWYSNVPYQAPVEVATIGQLPTYGSGVYDPWGPKIEFEDPSMQLPSARIANM